MSEVTVKARKIEIPDYLLGKNYEEDNNFRLELKDWIENIWSEKDKYIEELKT